MSTIAIIGAGPGLGLSIAKAFGNHGYKVALIARNRDRLDQYVAELGAAGIPAAGFSADVADRSQLADALASAARQLGEIEVLEYSPYAGMTATLPQDVTVETLQPEIDTLLYGAVASIQAVLPGMLAAGTGTLLFTTGGGAISAYPQLAAVNAAQAGLRNLAHNLHNTLGERGIYVATVAINVGITTEPGHGYPTRTPDDLARLYWRLHVERTEPEIIVNG